MYGTGTGETAIADTANSFSRYYTLSRTLLWLGRTLYGEWSKEYALLSSWSCEILGAENIELFGYKESGITAIFTGVILSENINITVPKPIIHHQSISPIGLLNKFLANACPPKRPSITALIGLSKDDSRRI